MRKFFGIILIVIGWLLSLFLILAILQTLIRTIQTISFDAYSLGYIFGNLLFFGLFGLFCYWLVKTGLRLTRKKKVNDLQEKIESIK